jgi:tRNA G10  N-methylase Trm11
VDVRHSAYLRYCVAVEAQGANLDELVADCRASGMAYEGFRLEILQPPPRQQISGSEVTLAVANAITGRPKLMDPAVILAVVITAQGWCCGRILSTGHNRWLQGMHRPHHFSSALPQRLSRALANLVASPGETLLDPCCGIGTVLMEALDAGILAFGVDQNGPMLKLVAENMAYLGLPCRLIRADARQLTGHFDGAVLDLPYGRNMIGNVALWRDLVAPLRTLASRSAIVAPQPLGGLLEELGLRLVKMVRVPKGGLVRHIHLVMPRV